MPIKFGSSNWEVRFKEATIEGRSEVLTSNKVPEWNEAISLASHVTGNEIAEFQLLRAKAIRNSLGKKDENRYGQIYSKIADKISELNYEENQDSYIVTLPAASLEVGETYEISFVLQLREKGSSVPGPLITVPTSVSIVDIPSSIPDNSIWLPADLHIHSIYSDGNENIYSLRDLILSGRGYRIAYMADHVGRQTKVEYLYRSQCLCPTGTQIPFAKCNVSNTWSCYVTNTQRASSASGISFFPGVEISAKAPGAPSGDGSYGDGEGHALGYGINSFPVCLNTVNVYDLSHEHQQVINAINSQSGASASIAHPTGSYDWPWTTNLYRGMELMSGYQLNFSSTSSPVSRWRSECARVVSSRQVFTNGWFPSVRTGSDYHAVSYHQYYTYVLVPVTSTEWNGLSWSSRRSHVDQALISGRTIASRHGSWARFSVNGNMPGSILKNMPSGTSLNISLSFRPSLNGTYYARIYRGNISETIDLGSFVDAKAGTTYTKTATVSFPGGDQFYWLYIWDAHSREYVYQSPIFITSGS